MSRYVLSDEQSRQAREARNIALANARPHSSLLALPSGSGGVVVFPDLGLTYEADDAGRLVRSVVSEAA